MWRFPSFREPPQAGGAIMLTAPFLALSIAIHPPTSTLPYPFSHFKKRRPLYLDSGQLLQSAFPGCFPRSIA